MTGRPTILVSVNYRNSLTECCVEVMNMETAFLQDYLLGDTGSQEWCHNMSPDGKEPEDVIVYFLFATD